MSDEYFKSKAYEAMNARYIGGFLYCSNCHAEVFTTQGERTWADAEAFLSQSRFPGVADILRLGILPRGLYCRACGCIYEFDWRPWQYSTFSSLVLLRTGPQRIKVLALVRQTLGVKLEEVRQLVDACPVILIQSEEPDEKARALCLHEALTAAGTDAELHTTVLKPSLYRAPFWPYRHDAPN